MVAVLARESDMLSITPCVGKGEDWNLTSNIPGIRILEYIEGSQPEWCISTGVALTRKKCVLYAKKRTGYANLKMLCVYCTQKKQ